MSRLSQTTRLTATTLAALLLALLVALANPFAATATTADAPAWTVETVDGDNGAGRPNFSYDIDPGASLSDAIRVTNKGSNPLPLSVYAADAFTTEAGAIDILAWGTPSTDAGLWITVSTPDIVLQPGESADVPFTITVPANATPGDHSAAIVASLMPGATGDQVQVERRLGLRVDLRVSGAIAPAAEIRTLTTDYVSGWNPFGGGTVTVTYELVNTGNVRLASLEELRVAGIGGSGAVALVGQEVPELLPGSAITVTRQFATSALGPIDGSLTLYLQPVGAFADQPVAVTAPVTSFAMPWALLVLVLIVLLAVAAAVFWWWRRRRLELLAAAYDHEDADGGADDGDAIEAPDARGRVSRAGARAAGGAAAVLIALALVIGGVTASPSSASAHAAADVAADAAADVASPAPTGPGGVTVEIPASTAPAGTAPASTAPTTTATTTPTAPATGGTGGSGGGAGGNNLVSTGGDAFSLIAAGGAAVLAVATGATLLALRRREQ